MGIQKYLPWHLSWRIDRLERIVAKDKDALARLDAQIADLKAYVASDEETDAAEVDKRAEDIRALLAEARGTGEVEEPVVVDVEAQLAAVAEDVAAQSAE